MWPAQRQYGQTLPPTPPSRFMHPNGQGHPPFIGPMLATTPEQSPPPVCGTQQTAMPPYAYMSDLPSGMLGDGEPSLADSYQPLHHDRLHTPEALDAARTPSPHRSIQQECHAERQAQHTTLRNLLRARKASFSAQNELDQIMTVRRMWDATLQKRVNVRLTQHAYNGKLPSMHFESIVGALQHVLQVQHPHRDERKCNGEAWKWLLTELRSMKTMFGVEG
jgi:hypothetical protein